MKNNYKYALIALAAFSFAACNDMIESSEPAVDIERTIILTATREGTDPNTRSVRMDDGTTWWSPKEEISVFYGSGANGGSKFTSNNTTLAETTEFEGSISMSGNKEFWAVYPYSTENTCDGNSIITIIPDYQIGSEGNFSNDAIPAMGKSGSLSMPFYNICGGIKFFVSRADIKSVTFKGNNGEVLAGKVKVTFGADGKPEVAEVIEGQTEVTLTAPDGGAFKAGKYYYVTLLSGLLDGGFTMSFTTASETGTLKSDKQQTIKRSVFGTLKNIDSKVAEWESNVPIPEYVDLGLSVKWASCNVGASKPEEYGDYFAWGEVNRYYNGEQSLWMIGKEAGYRWASYIWCNGDFNRLTKYNNYSQSGLVDNKTILEPDDDAAAVNLGGSWRMPTFQEQEELVNECIWESTTIKGVKGHKVYNKNNPSQSIFLPASGFWSNTDYYGEGSIGYYWSLSLDSESPSLAHSMQNNITENTSCLNSQPRCYGFNIRPVYAENIPVTSITLSESSIKLLTGTSRLLTASIQPYNATDKSITWKSSDTSIITVDTEGTVSAISNGWAFIQAISTNGIIAECEVWVEIMPEIEAIDLGLSVKWASLNIGATKPEEYGDFFAWGEIEPYYEPGGAQSSNPVWKTNKYGGYTWSSYKWCFGSNITICKYNDNRSFGPFQDNKTVLDPEDDAAHVNWGGSWRMPTKTEMDELANNCTWTWTSLNGVNGFIISGVKQDYTNNTIFLPAAGFRTDAWLNTGTYYWTSSLVHPNNACSCSWYGEYHSGTNVRCSGLSIRPVCPKD